MKRLPTAHEWLIINKALAEIGREHRATDWRGTQGGVRHVPRRLRLARGSQAGQRPAQGAIGQRVAQGERGGDLTAAPPLCYTGVAVGCGAGPGARIGGCVNDGGLTLIVAGTVRRGVLTEYDGQCDGCGQAAGFVLTSPKGRETPICAKCVAACGKPEPERVGGVLCDSVQAVRSAVARGECTQTVAAFKRAEEYERRAAHWVRATRKHGFKRVVARPHHDRAIWSPYS